MSVPWAKRLSGRADVYGFPVTNGPLMLLHPNRAGVPIYGQPRPTVVMMQPPASVIPPLPPPPPAPRPPVPPYGVRFWNSAQTCTNTCPEGYSGEPISVTVPANTYDSTVSQEAANEEAMAAACAEAAALREETPCDFSGIVTIFSKTRSGVPELVGCAEFGTPSAPDRYYRRAEWDGTLTNNCTGAFAADCSSIVNVTNCTNTGFVQYNAITGAPSLGGTNICNGVIVGTGTDCSTPSSQFCETLSGIELATLVTINSPTSLSRIEQEVCCITRTILGSILFSCRAHGTQNKTLSDEDNEADAINRFRLANPYGPFVECVQLPFTPSPTPISCCPTSYQQRVSGRTFDYEESEGRAEITGLAPGVEYLFRLEITRTNLATMEQVVSGYIDIQGFANGSGELDGEFTMPVDVGFAYAITNAQGSFA